MAETHAPCAAALYRIDPATGEVRVVRHVPTAVGDLAVSPGGHSVAFVTYPTCETGHGPQAAALGCSNGPPGACSLQALRSQRAGARLRRGGNSEWRRRPWPGRGRLGDANAPLDRQVVRGGTYYFWKVTGHVQKAS